LKVTLHRPSNRLNCGNTVLDQLATSLARWIDRRTPRVGSFNLEITPRMRRTIGGLCILKWKSRWQNRDEPLIALRMINHPGIHVSSQLLLRGCDHWHEFGKNAGHMPFYGGLGDGKLRSDDLIRVPISNSLKHRDFAFSQCIVGNVLARSAAISGGMQRLPEWTARIVGSNSFRSMLLRRYPAAPAFRAREACTSPR